MEKDVLMLFLGLEREQVLPLFDQECVLLIIVYSHRISIYIHIYIYISYT